MPADSGEPVEGVVLQADRAHAYEVLAGLVFVVALAPLWGCLVGFGWACFRWAAGWG